MKKKNQSSLPPGVTSNMIPGDGPTDVEWANLSHNIFVLLQDSGLRIVDCQRAVEIGISVIMSARQEFTKELMNLRCNKCLFQKQKGGGKR